MKRRTEEVSSYTRNRPFWLEREQKTDSLLGKASEPALARELDKALSDLTREDLNRIREAH